MWGSGLESTRLLGLELMGSSFVLVKPTWRVGGQFVEL